MNIKPKCFYWALLLLTIPLKTQLSFLRNNLHNYAKNLGVHFYPLLQFDKHVNAVVKSSFFQLRSAAKVKHFLSIRDLERVIHALISSHLDYCNYLDIGLTQSTLYRLQMVQNAAARFLTGTKKRDHITSVLASLHWLPIKLRVDFKILLFAYKALHNSALDYISDLTKPYKASRSLRSSDQLLLSVPRSRCKTKGDRDFSVVAPKLWNGLPLNIRASPSLNAFKSSLKTYFYSLAFEWCIFILNSLMGALWNYIVNCFWYLFYFLLSPLPFSFKFSYFSVNHFGSTTVVLNLCSINKIWRALPKLLIYNLHNKNKKKQTNKKILNLNKCHDKLINSP